MGTPGDGRRILGIVLREIVDRDLDGQVSGDVAEVLGCEGITIILGVTGHKELSAVFGADQMHTGDGGSGKDLQCGNFFDILRTDLSMAGMGGGVLAECPPGVRISGGGGWVWMSGCLNGVLFLLRCSTN